MFKRATISSIGGDVKQMECSHIADGSVQCYKTLENSLAT